MRGVHGSTVSRALAKIRRAILDRVRATLVAEHGVSDTECDSLMLAVRTELDLSVSRLLAPPEEP
jgi:hypothetical protein